MQSAQSPRTALARALIAYYGVIQAVHLMAIARSFALLMRSGEITFLGQPPPGGWTVQAQHFLVGLGAIDVVNAVLALVFVYGYFSRARWWFWLGTLTLTTSVCSALAYGYGTMASGAWIDHLAEYLILVVAFVPVAVLAGLFAVWGRRGGANGR